ncbi:hypothetical protein JQC92_20315, partial [Shewanella sp. 202IG2-18]|uniref:hypothetical protein n=1 Tax=Parashewanella hymeniacidonis TaxID=2807618 RepID=UPI00196075B9
MMFCKSFLPHSLPATNTHSNTISNVYSLKIILFMTDYFITHIPHLIFPNNVFIAKSFKVAIRSQQLWQIDHKGIAKRSQTATLVND